MKKDASEYSRIWEAQNKERRSEYKRNYYKANKEKMCSDAKLWRAQNKDKTKAYALNSYYRNIEKRRELSRLYYSKNKEAILEKQKKRRIEDPNYKHYEKIRKSRDPLFKLNKILRVRFKMALKQKKWGKRSSVLSLLGADLKCVKAHIEIQFKPGMSWSNHGKWHIDHIVPLASAKTEEDVILLWHYKNLQPLWASENLKKGGK